MLYFFAGLFFTASAAAVPLGYVVVPGGFAHAACVHEVAAGTLLDQRSLPECPHPFLRSGGGPSNDTHGSAWKAWMQYSGSSPSSSVTALNSTWIVPATPQNEGGGQVLFWWNGVEPLDTSAVLQPVIQWGPSAAGGGNYWAYASWYVSSSHGSHFSQLVKIASGEKVLGTNTRSADGSWVISASAPGKAPSVLNFKPVPGAWATAYHVLEAYGVSSDCSLYPAAGSENFTGVALAIDYAPVAPIAWKALTQNAGCGEHATADASGQEVSIITNTQ